MEENAQIAGTLAILRDVFRTTITHNTGIQNRRGNGKRDLKFSHITKHALWMRFLSSPSWGHWVLRAVPASNNFCQIRKRGSRMKNGFKQTNQQNEKRNGFWMDFLYPRNCPNVARYFTHTFARRKIHSKSTSARREIHSKSTSAGRNIHSKSM